MCGIAGIIGEGIKRSEIEKMLVSISHRGPDARGIYCDRGYAVLGHNRLSIIDLSHAGDQPFSDPTGRYHLSFNGEIYNYKELKLEIGSRYIFKTNSDTEVLLAAYIIYGKNCLEKLNGMFAFAIWDSREKKIFAARDRFGVKPFYYSECHSKLIFASEIKAIRNIRSSGPNEKVWSNYFCFGSYGSPSETFYKDIDQLPAGYCMEYKDFSLSIKKWYDCPSRIKDISNNYSIEEIKENYLELLLDSIRLRFRADVEVGFNISGGVDSSLLLALVNNFKSNQKVKAFTFYTGDKQYDELPWVEKMIGLTGNPLEKIKLSSAEVPQLSKLLSDIQEEPFGGIPTIAYSKIFERANQSGLKVLMDGQGMDEQWAGYDYYNSLVDQVIQGTGKSGSFRPDVLNSGFQDLAKKPEYPTPFESSLQNLQYRDLFYTKLPRALRFNDRISMAFSTELREPFLDYRLVELAFSLQDSLKINKGVQKYLLRKIIKDFVPDNISEAPKRALQTPQREWLGGELKVFVDENLARLENSCFQSWFDHDLIQKEWSNYKNGKNSNSFFLWQWINASLISTLVD
ncbi:asparagine synthase (glutamine-hydrolyzing) [Christiangramia salexigens]|uniref:asparagine synthase (glutamine-hydrolyzing) n=1 Tax=Christiangramia salexigens TaxID=1913577 RepID=A0A1L3J4M4_9FLAO|nr:asparagine synthase (glutamine-hydrolyzing) [Christiangramia salexigens]APG60099.1 asparagine synthase (glutamine-hydrolyzing) [Christiangramia salexigens]